MEVVCRLVNGGEAKRHQIESWALEEGAEADEEVEMTGATEEEDGDDGRTTL